MRPLRPLILITVAPVAVAMLSACQSPSGSATTRPSLATLTTQTEAALDVAVNVIHVGLDLKLIDPDTYWREIDPIVTAGQAACATMRADANAGDVSGASAARDAVLDAVSKLQPFVSTIQAQAAKAKKASST